MWKKDVKLARSKAIASIDKIGLSDEQYGIECAKARLNVEKGYQQKAYQYLQIANPAHGEGFFRLIWDYNWSPVNPSWP